MHRLSFRKADLHDLPINAAAHRHGVKRGKRSEPVEIDRQVSPLRRSYNHGNRLPWSARPLSAALSAGNRASRTLRLGTVLRLRIPNPQRNHDRERDNPQPPAALGCRSPSGTCRIHIRPRQFRRFQITHSFSPVTGTILPSSLRLGACVESRVNPEAVKLGTQPIGKPGLCLDKTAPRRERLRLVPWRKSFQTFRQSSASTTDSHRRFIDLRQTCEFNLLHALLIYCMRYLGRFRTLARPQKGPWFTATIFRLGILTKGTGRICSKRSSLESF